MDGYVQRLIRSCRLEASEVIPYLGSMGYKVFERPICGLTWVQGAEMPKFLVRVSGHEEFEKHTYYSMSCEVKLPGQAVAAMRWQLRRRLWHLRAGLHDPVKTDLGVFYAKSFGQSRFARYGGLPGTTHRLDEWCQALARCIGDRDVTPVVAAAIFKVLGAPSSIAPSSLALGVGGLQSAGLSDALDGFSIDPPSGQTMVAPELLHSSAARPDAKSIAIVQDVGSETDDDEDHLINEYLTELPFGLSNTQGT